MPSAVGSYKALPNSPEPISKFKSPVLCKQSLCFGKCHLQHIGRGANRHPSSRLHWTHTIHGLEDGVRCPFLYWGQQMLTWLNGGIWVGFWGMPQPCPSAGSWWDALVFRGPKPRVRASRRPQQVSGGFIQPERNEQAPGWASSMLLALAECPHWLRKTEKLFPVRQGTGRNTSWRQLKAVLEKFQPP